MCEPVLDVAPGVCQKRAAGNPAVSAWLHLAHAYHNLQRRIEIGLESQGLTLAQFDVLATMANAEGLTQQELAERLLVTKGNVCGLIDRLERRGLVERRDDPEDRRANRLFITQAGRSLFDEALPEHFRLVGALVGHLTPQEVSTLIALVGKLASDEAVPLKAI